MYLIGLTSLTDLKNLTNLVLRCSSFLPHNHPCSSEGHPVVLKERSDRRQEQQDERSAVTPTLN